MQVIYTIRPSSDKDDSSTVDDKSELTRYSDVTADKATTGVPPHIGRHKVLSRGWLFIIIIIIIIIIIFVPQVVQIPGVKN